MIRTVASLLVVTACAFGAENMLRYDRPAEKWVEALPIGNGRLGAMNFGGLHRERLQINEATLWSGGPKDWNNAGARAALPKVREAIFAGRYAEAGELCKRMQGPYNQSYQPLGNLLIDFEGVRRQTGGDARQIISPPGRPPRKFAGVVRGLRRDRCPAPPRVAPLWSLSGKTDHAGHAGFFLRRAPRAGTPG